MAESLFWFPRHSSGCTNQAAQKNVSCLLTGIRSVADRCLCLRNAHIWKILLQFCRAQHLEIPALADPPSTTLVGLPARSKSFSPAGFPSRLLNLQSHLVLTALSVLLTELSGNRNNSSPSRLLQSLWKDWLVHCDSLLLFSFFFPSSAWVYVLDITWHRDRRGRRRGWAVGVKLEQAGTRCAWCRDTVCSWGSPFRYFWSYGRKARKNKKPFVSDWHIFKPFQSILIEFSGDNPAKQSICPQNKQPKWSNAL